jgi:NADH-quinone oxidoreductase subunit N
LDAGLIWLTILGLLNSAVAAYYYLRIIVVMYFHEPGQASASVTPLAPGIQVAVWGSALATLLLGFFPSLLLEFAQQAALLAR